MRSCFQETREMMVDEIFQEMVDGYNPIGLKLIT
jgi:hypothetical protein